MKKSYFLSKSIIPSHFVSKHWDIYPKNFGDNLFDKDKLSKFRNNELSFKCNDTLEKRTSVKEIRVLQRLSKIVNRGFIENNKEEKIGKPKTFNFNKSFYDYHDLFLIYFFHVLLPFINQKSQKKKRVFILEIGGGYGGLAYKIKRSFPETTCILLDLPEANFISNHYIKSLEPKAKILNLEKILKQKGVKTTDYLSINESDILKYDYVILPGYLLENFVGRFIDFSINTRSFMEMNLQTINFYFCHIQRLIAENGFFYCVNRYKKSTSGDIVKFKKFPFDKFWDPIVWQKSFFQPMIHEALLKRQVEENSSFMKKLNRLKPYDVEFFTSFI